jgi:hypothetical protein
MRLRAPAAALTISLRNAMVCHTAYSTDCLFACFLSYGSILTHSLTESSAHTPTLEGPTCSELNSNGDCSVMTLQNDCLIYVKTELKCACPAVKANATHTK